MSSSLAITAMVCFVVGTFVVAALAARAGAGDSIARVLYDTEHPRKTP